MIVGIDEVGRGPWAGPLVVGAVVLGGAEIEGITDSKKLTKRRREALSEQIHQQAAAVGLGWVSATELDEYGMSSSLQLATRRALQQITVPYHEIIIDGTVNLLAGTTHGNYVTTLPKADLLVPSVSAASIVAKVARDTYMSEQGELYPEYGFGQHAGYGVAKHREAIVKHGVTPLHRLSFAPLAAYRPSDWPEQPVVAKNASKTTRQIGDNSEDVAAQYLQQHGHAIIERNWRTRRCELDIISEKNGEIYCVEVKHRRKADAGDGLAAITSARQKQLAYAARMYTHWRGLDEAPLRLLVIATSGDAPTVERCVEIT